MKKSIAVIIPTYNESPNILELYKRLITVLKKHPYGREIIFVDNNSTDKTVELIEKLQKKDKTITIIRLSRNFGSSQPSYLAGIHACNSDAAILIDSDLQDPPEIIHKFIEKWESGIDVVYGVRIKRKGSTARKIGYKLFYRLFKYLSYINIPLDAGDFSLIDKKVINAMKTVVEKDYYIRGVRSFVGFSQIGVPYVRDDRKKGKSSLSYFDNFYWAKKAIINFSTKPLELISLISLFIACISFIAILFYFYLYLFTPNKPQGIPTIITLILFLGSIQLLSLSVVAEYIGNMFTEIKKRPTYIIKTIKKAK